MSGDKIFLDSNIIIELFSGNKAISEKIKSYPSIYISSIVLGELYIGVNRVFNKEKHLKKLNSFLELCTLLDVDAETARHFGEITAYLYKKGKPIPTNDVWIASSVKQDGLLLITRDQHFREIEEVISESW